VRAILTGSRRQHLYHLSIPHHPVLHTGRPSTHQPLPTSILTPSVWLSQISSSSAKRVWKFPVTQTHHQHLHNMRITTPRTARTEGQLSPSGMPAR